MASPTAAAQVLGLPELLEHILFYVGKDSYHNNAEFRSTLHAPLQLLEATLDGYDNNTSFRSSNKYEHHPTPHPAMALFVLQRVNRTFQSVILDSRKLRDLMCLQKSSSTRLEDRQVPLIWLLMRNGFNQVNIRELDSARKTTSVMIYNRRYHDTWSRASFVKVDHPTASWRQMIVKPTVVGGFVQTFRVTESKTLGEVYDWNLKSFRK
ncbi:hypothetical protein CLAFUW4_06489 [Fulvia fulva]|uniref:F-box domain-containing protein n=1 Tax=Passalora fulva TaxID=5499 RepID=A0A9Q8LJE6_PASFU|nr:uncharacterized protein CLAFUR5_06634 [Fulvia fulva]KAK4621714.1 hypothetical protein CLAFUR4_06493 [Fulvia fulva]KAK4622799.1 hypothetical protein CLAFUR0_06494 [Fulvia fulva]UJO18498.1 hypothetical protein CLAFUR5_06634 [Fulvia fulva]WPV15952.1 hypothetical protein CLAFUW4_06489 [Fulvia fulva]WPV30682.1 hypothetical protein CLAFUW7_06489 [Fulvia fulva]